MWHHRDTMDSEIRLLEISIPASDVRASLEWYRALGFIELTTNDIRQYHYAVVSDGELCVGFHSQGLEQSGLSFVRPELAVLVREALAQGIEFEIARIGIDDFHEAVRSDPTGNPAVLIEGRTFSPPHENAVGTIGRLSHVALPCMDVEESLSFWESYGFIGVQGDDGDPVELHTPGLTMQLQNGVRELTLYYQNDDPGELVTTLERLGITARKTPFGRELRAPEGTRLIIQSD